MNHQRVTGLRRCAHRPQRVRCTDGDVRGNASVRSCVGEWLPRQVDRQQTECVQTATGGCCVSRGIPFACVTQPAHGFSVATKVAAVRLCLAGAPCFDRGRRGGFDRRGRRNRGRSSCRRRNRGWRDRGWQCGVLRSLNDARLCGAGFAVATARNHTKRQQTAQSNDRCDCLVRQPPALYLCFALLHTPSLGVWTDNSSHRAECAMPC